VYKRQVLRQPVHNCVHMPRYPFDIMVYLLPLESCDEQTGFCTYTQMYRDKDSFYSRHPEMRRD